MDDFKKYRTGKKNIIKNRLGKLILELFSEIAGNYIYEKRYARIPNTNTIKYNLVKLGHKLGYRVYANGLTAQQKKEQFELHGFVCREFLYDVHWYSDIADKYYTPETVSLVAESELGDRRKGDLSKQRNPAIKFDFQKLLVANSGLRLMIFKVYKLEHLQELNDYFTYAINTYDLLRRGDCFLFICFVHETKELYFAEKIKKRITIKRN